MKKIQLIIFIITISFSIRVFANLNESPLVPKKEVAFAKDFLAKIRNKEFDYILKYIDPELKKQVSRAKLQEISDYFPKGKLLTTELMGSQVNITNSTWQGNFSFEYKFEGGWAVANVLMKRVNEQVTVIGFHVYQTQNSQKEFNKFTLSGKSISHYVILAITCFVPIFIIITLIVCSKTPALKRKWLWILFILVSFGAVNINWTTGEYSFQLLRFQLLGAGFTAASDYAPWIITAGFPLGAIIFWFKKILFIKQSKTDISIQQTTEVSSD